MIVCFGEALIDFKATGPLAFQGFVGGSPLNVSLAVARLGTPVALASQVSRDLFGEAILAHLEANGVDRSLIVRDDAPSALAFVAESGGDVDFTFVGDLYTRYDPRPRPKLPDETRFLEFSSLSLVREPGASAILETVGAHRERCTVVFDPNIRPALIPSRDAYEPVLETALRLSHLVKVSSQDLAWLYPGADPLAEAESWLGRGPEAVIVTQGGSRTVLLRSQGRLEVSCSPSRGCRYRRCGRHLYGCAARQAYRKRAKHQLGCAAGHRMARRTCFCGGSGGAQLYAARCRPAHAH